MNTSNPSQIFELFRTMPEVVKRRPYDDNKPKGYLESDRCFVENNMDAVIWFLENAATLKEMARNLSSYTDCPEQSKTITRL